MREVGLHPRPKLLLFVSIPVLESSKSIAAFRNGSLLATLLLRREIATMHHVTHSAINSALLDHMHHVIVAS